MADRARHAFGMLENIDSALTAGTIDAFDILFVKDANGNPYVGWIDKNGNKVILEDKTQVVRVDELPTADGDENVVYIYNNEGYIWDGTKCVSLSKSADVTALETQVSTLATQMENKVDAATVETMVETVVEEKLVEVNTGYEIVEF